MDACKDMSKCRILNDFTATYYGGYYCEKKHIRATIQSIYSFGCILGMFLLPALADLKGRKFSFVFGFGIALIGITLVFIGIYNHIDWLIIFGRFIDGIFSAGIVVVTYVLAA